MSFAHTQSGENDNATLLLRRLAEGTAAKVFLSDRRTAPSVRDVGGGFGDKLHCHSLPLGECDALVGPHLLNEGFAVWLICEFATTTLLTAVAMN